MTDAHLVRLVAVVVVLASAGLAPDARAQAPGATPTFERFTGHRDLERGRARLSEGHLSLALDDLEDAEQALIRTRERLLLVESRWLLANLYRRLDEPHEERRYLRMIVRDRAARELWRSVARARLSDSPVDRRRPDPDVFAQREEGGFDVGLFVTTILLEVATRAIGALLLHLSGCVNDEDGMGCDEETGAVGGVMAVVGGAPVWGPVVGAVLGSRSNQR